MVVPSWLRVVIAGCLIAILGVVLGDPARSFARAIVAIGFGYVGVRTLRRSDKLLPLPWLLIILGGLIALVSAVVRLVHGSLVDEQYPFPSPADSFVVVAYIFFVLGTMSLVRARTVERSPEDVVDALLVTLIVFVPIVSTVFGSYWTDDTVGLGERSLNATFLVLDAAIVISVARVSFGPGVRNWSYYLLAIATLLVIADDVLFRLDSAHVGWALEAALSVAPFGFVFGGAAIVHEEAPRLTERPRHVETRLTIRRVALLLVAAVGGPVLIGFAATGVVSASLPLLITGTVLTSGLVFVRMVEMVRANERIVERERRLRAAGEAMANSEDRTEIDRISLEAALAICHDARDLRVSMVEVGGGAVTVRGSVGHLHEKVPTGDLDRGDLPDELWETLERGTLGGLETAPAVDLAPDVEPHPVFTVLAPVRRPTGVSGVLVATSSRVIRREVANALAALGERAGLGYHRLELIEQSHRQRADRRANALIEQGSDLVVVADDDWNVVFASPSADRLLRHGEQPLVGRRVVSFSHVEDRFELVQQLSEPSPRDQHVSSNEVRFRAADGSYRWFEVSVRDFRDESEVGGLVITGRDITERRAAERRLLWSEARFRSLVQNSSDIVAILDDSGSSATPAPRSSRSSVSPPRRSRAPARSSFSPRRSSSSCSSCPM